MECFLIIVTIITKLSISDVTVTLDPPLPFMYIDIYMGVYKINTEKEYLAKEAHRKLKSQEARMSAIYIFVLLIKHVIPIITTMTTA